MSFISLTDYADDDKGPLTAAPEGEYNLRIKDMDTDSAGDMILFYTGPGGEDDKRPYLRPVLEIIDDVNADNYNDIRHFLKLPTKDMEGKEKKKCLNRLDEFGKAFGIDLFGGDLTKEDFINRVGAGILSLTESDQYGEQNNIKQLLIAR